ncbi:MAG: Ppx/GppA family phosphatase [Alphaproteobacteria bacterium]|nr:Ppx/GppA family phosphatase [Alphaproteobacteria bacterium]
MSVKLTATSEQRLGVIDIGSNSIRLVVYDRLSRAPLPIVNNKVVVGLGTDVERLGRLSDSAFWRAVDAIDALVRTAQDVPVSNLALLATAAVRSAENGEEFCRTVEAKTGCIVTTLSGDEEARLSALGVVSAVPDLTGVVGDLGGGSLELVALRNGEIVEQTSLNIGPLRLIERTGGKLDDAAKVVDKSIDQVDWLRDWRGLPFVAVGGAWRAIARLHMAQHDYPLQIVHGYHMARREARDFTEMLEHFGQETIAQIRTISSKRAETLPWGSIALDRLTATLKPSELIFSAHGLREGHHFQMLDRATQAQDPLLSACRELASQHRRFSDASNALVAWLEPIVGHLENGDPKLVRATCMLADIAWSEHPEYRAEQAMLRVLRMPWSVLDHIQRAFLGLAVFVRYGGSGSSKQAAVCHRLLDDAAARDAKSLGKALRLALEICAGRGQILAATPIEYLDKSLHLTLEPSAMIASVNKVERYANSLGRALGRPVEVISVVSESIEKKKAAG